MDQLAFDLQEETEIEAAAEAQKTAPEGDAEEATPAKRTTTIAHRCLIILIERKKSSRPAMPAAIVVARSSNLAKMSPRSWNTSPATSS